MKKPIRLTRRTDPRSIHDPPPSPALEERNVKAHSTALSPVYVLHEVEKGVFDYPFPLSQESQIKLLNLVRNRKSGIIARSELEQILFPKRTIKKFLIQGIPVKNEVGD